MKKSTRKNKTNKFGKIWDRKYISVGRKKRKNKTKKFRKIWCRVCNAK